MNCASYPVFLLLWVAPAFSQGCAMCYQREGHQQGGQKAISRGVLVLLLPRHVHDLGRRHGSPLQ
jgi:hypothetical protein